MLKWVLTSAGIVTGAVAAQHTGFCFEGWTPVLCGAGFALLLISGNLKTRLIFIFVFAFLYGLSAVALDRDHFTHVAWRSPKKIIILSGEVTSFPERAGPQWKWEFKVYEFRMEAGEWRKAAGRVEVSVPAVEIPPLIGDKLIIKGQIQFPAEDSPGASWKRRRFFLNNIQAEIRVKKFGDIVFTGWNPWFFPLRNLQLIRELGSAQIEKLYSVEQSAVICALLLGLRMPDPKLRMVFSKTGTSQVLAGANRGIFDSAFSSHFTATAFTKTY